MITDSQKAFWKAELSLDWQEGNFKIYPQVNLHQKLFHAFITYTSMF